MKPDQDQGLAIDNLAVLINRRYIWEWLAEVNFNYFDRSKIPEFLEIIGVMLAHLIPL